MGGKILHFSCMFILNIYLKKIIYLLGTEMYALFVQEFQNEVSQTVP